MKARLNMEEAKALLPLLKSISFEVRERRKSQTRLENLRADLVRATRRTPEGFTQAMQDVDSQLSNVRYELRKALEELEELGLEVPSLKPLVVYIPGTAEGKEVIFYWEEGDPALETGADLGTEVDTESSAAQNGG
jgi:hypothetical protein